jgi:hypothetical protein
MRPFVHALGAATLAAATLLCVSPALAASPISVQQCFVTVPKALSHNASGTQIVYVNRGRQAASSVTFEVAYRNAAHTFVRRVTDVGDFAPGAQINHRFSLFSDVTYAGKAVRSCRAITVKWADGKVWHWM